jgi:hypothetical protein
MVIDQPNIDSSASEFVSYLCALPSVQTKDEIGKCRDICKAKVADPSAPGDPNR